MLPLLDKVVQVINRLNERVGEYASWLNVVLIFLVCVDVFNRYLLNVSTAWVTELEWHLFALIFLLSAGFSWKHDRHVRVDLFYVKFSARNKAMVDALGSIFFLIPWTIALMVVSWKYAWKSFEIREASPDPGGLAAYYPIKFALCIGLFLLLLQAVSQLISHLNIWLNKTDSNTAS